MSNSNQSYVQGDPWRDQRQVFRAVGVVVLLIFSVFVLFDALSFYKKHVTRCSQAPDLPECGFLNLAKPNSASQLDIVLDQGSGKWAVQLEAMNQETADQNLRRLAGAGVTARLIKMGQKKRVFYYLQLGRFKTQKDALEAGRQLKARGLLTGFTVSSYRSASN